MKKILLLFVIFSFLFTGIAIAQPYNKTGSPLTGNATDGYSLPGSLAIGSTGGSATLTLNGTAVNATSGTTKTVTETTGVTLTANDGGEIVSNSGSGVSPTPVWVPAPVSGLEGLNYTVVQVGVTPIYIDPVSGQFKGLYSTNASGDKLLSTGTDGETLSILCKKGADGSYYYYTSGWGGWADAN